MKVQRFEQIPEPGYPSRQQFFECKLLLGAAVIGFAISGCTGSPQLVTDGKVVSESLGSSPSNNGLVPKVVDIEPVFMPSGPQPPPVTTAGLIRMEPFPEIDVQKYIVQKGDSLYGIAKKKWGAGKLWPSLLQANPGLTEKNLKPGQIIKVPSIP